MGVEEEMLPEERRRVLNDVRELFAGKPSVEIFQRSFRRDTVYEDPLSRAVGIKQVAAQWYKLSIVFPSPHNLSSRLLSSTPTQMVFSQRQEYTVRGVGVKRTVESLVVIDLDPSDKVVKMMDLWNGEDPPMRWGMGLLRRLHGMTLPWVFRVPKEVSRVE